MKTDPPVIPEDTCPYIDMVQELLDRIAKQPDQGWREQQVETAKHLLEHIRVSNQKLRDGGRYWYQQNTKTLNKRMTRGNYER